MTYDLTYLSLGAGVQSSALLVMSNLGLHGCPKADVAIFADTQSEPAWVYDQLERLREWSEIPVEVVTAGNLMKDLVDRQKGSKKPFVAIPGFTGGSDGRASPLRRQCTREYKIAPIEKRVRELAGYRRGQHLKKDLRCLIGISLDEISRMKPNPHKRITNEWPLVEARLRRADCTRIVEAAGLPTPRKSACICCPYHSDAAWQELKATDDWPRVVEFDAAIRDMSMSGDSRPVYLHRNLVPIDEVIFDNGQRDLSSLWDEECEGMCGV